MNANAQVLCIVWNVIWLFACDGSIRIEKNVKWCYYNLIMRDSIVIRQQPNMSKIISKSPTIFRWKNSQIDKYAGNRDHPNVLKLSVWKWEIHQRTCEQRHHQRWWCRSFRPLWFLPLHRATHKYSVQLNAEIITATHPHRNYTLQKAEKWSTSLFSLHAPFDRLPHVKWVR